MFRAVLGKNAFVDVAFPVVIDNFYVHLAERPGGGYDVRVFEYDPVSQTGREVEFHDATARIRVESDPAAPSVRIEAIGDSATGEIAGSTHRVVIADEQITVWRGDVRALDMKGGSVRGLPVGIKITGDSISIGGWLPPGLELHSVWEGREVKLADLVTPDRPIIKDMTFLRCRLLGPALLAARAQVTFDGDVFILGEVQQGSVVWEVPPTGEAFGVIHLFNVEIVDCELHCVAIVTGRGDYEATLRQVFG